MGLLIKCAICGQYVGEEPTPAEFLTEEGYDLAARDFEKRQERCPHDC